MDERPEEPLIGEKASDGIGIAPPSTSEELGTQPVRDAVDASELPELRRNPSDEGAKLEIALDETFPTSDPPSNTQPGKGNDPAPSSGYDPEAERARARD